MPEAPANAKVVALSNQANQDGAPTLLELSSFAESTNLSPSAVEVVHAMPVLIAFPVLFMRVGGVVAQLLPL